MPGPATALAFLATALIVAVGGWQILRGHDDALRHAESETRTLARTLSQHAERTIETIDLGLSTIVDEVETGRDPHAVVDRFRGTGLLEQLHNLAVTDDTGRWLADTAPPHPEVNSADRPYFLWFKTHDDASLYFAPVVTGRTSGRPGFPVSRRINTPDGAFAGVAVATFAPEYFVRFYKDIRVGEQEAISLWTTGGRLLVRYPELPASQPESAVAEAAKAFADGAPSSSRRRSPLDGIERLYAFEHVGRYPIVVLVGASIDDALAAWRHEAAMEGAVVAAAAIALAVLGIAIERRRRRMLALEATSQQAEKARAAEEARFLQRLAEANRLLLLAEEIGHSGHWRLEFPTHHVTWSDEVYRIHGRDRETFRPTMETAIAHYHPDDRAEVERLVGEAVSTRGGFRFDLRIVRPDGMTRHVVSRGVCEIGPGGEVSAIFGTFMDVTELHEAEAALAASEARYRLLADNSTDMVTHMDLTGRRLFISPGSRELLGYAPEELVGTWPQTMIHPDDKAGLEILFGDLAGGRRSAAVNVNRLRHRDGRWIWVEASLKLLCRDDGSPAGIVGALRDITDRKLADQALRESERRYRILTETSSDVVTQLDLSMRRRYVSPSCWKMLGHRPEDLLGVRPAASIHPDEVENVRALANRLAAGEIEGDRATVTYRTLHKQGHWVWVEAILTLLRDEDTGAPLSLICSLRDVTERQRTARHLERATVLAEQAARVKAEFLANMSHELRTPLTGIIGVHDLLRADPALSDEQRRLVRLAGDAGRSLLTVVNDVLDFSKMDAGQFAIETVPFDADDLFAGCHDFARSTLAGKPIDIRLRRDPSPLGTFEGDPTRIKQLLLNFITNAVKFTARGTIEIVATYDASTSTLRVEVADSGIGIPADRIDRLFERFTQADTSMSRRYGGTGLGLAICKRLVDLMNGEIGALNRPGGGSSFWFEIPLARRVGSVAGRSPVAAPAETGSRHRILLAEDNAFNAEIVGVMLSSRGYAVSHVADGTAAVDAFRRRGFDLVLMDMQMPVMDGLQAARRIREHEQALRLSRTPIVGLTANAFSEDARQCLDAGMDAHVAKPIDWQALLATLQRLIRAKREAEVPRLADALGQGLPVLQQDRLRELAALFGPDRLADLLAQFVDELRAKRTRFEEMTQADLSDELHNLVSTSGQFGLTEFSALCAEINLQIRNGGSGADRRVDLYRAATRADEAIRTSSFMTAA